MEVDELVVTLRKRSHWSAIDLGISLARHWYRPLILSWLLPMLLFFVPLALALRNYPEMVMILIWWLKPVFERFQLYILSGRLFGEHASAMDAWRDFRHICTPDIVPWQLWRRLNPLRSFVMPVTLLERLQGVERDQRITVLQMEGSGPAMWLTVIFIHIETVLPLVLLFLLNWLLPPETGVNLFTGLLEQEAWLMWTANGFTLLSMALVAPFYVTSGFMLYINRRVSLEAWDLELNFRNLARRAKTGIAGTVAGALLTLSFAYFLVSPGVALAESLAPATVDTAKELQTLTDEAQWSREAITTVMEREEFNRTVRGYEWRWKYSEDEVDDSTDQVPDWLIRLVEYLEKLNPNLKFDATEVLAWTLRTLIVTALALALIYILYHYRATLGRWLKHQAPREDQVEAPPETLFGLAVHKESLPEDVPGEVQSLWSAGEHRASVALLYRATLSRLIHDHAFEFSEGLTETECAALVERRGEPSLHRFFSDLSGGWQALAYGHRDPEPEWVKLCCQRWQEIFGHD